MKMKRRVAVMGILSLLAVTATCVWAAGRARLVMNGKTVSNDVQTIGGKAYVPLSDLARAQGAVVVRNGGTYEIRRAGGATPIAGVKRGKVGDVLFDGKWRFQVLSVDDVDSYRMTHKSTVDYAVYNSIAEYDTESRRFTPRRNRILMALKCRVTNGRNSKQALWLSNTDTRTGLADSEGESHPPIAYDIEESTPFQSKALLPGAKIDFTVLFSVPEDVKIKDLVFTLRNINNSDRGSDVRVSLDN